MNEGKSQYSGTDARATQVGIALENLQGTIHDLEVSISTLEERLDAVIMPYTSKECTDPKDVKGQAKVILATRLENYNYNLQLLVDKVKSMGDCLEL